MTNREASEPGGTERVGVRALQQHASQVIRTVAEGSIVEVTDRGRLVAHLVPAVANRLTLWTVAGVARPATRSVTQLPPPAAIAESKRTLAQLLAKSRADER